ncbi:MAG TPA: histidinol-phosphate transaminase [Thermoanaerobaculia bacterium]|nr:histidinol-phosphate transaminase [Thermoanaerobaculia bacterium]
MTQTTLTLSRRSFAQLLGGGIAGGAATAALRSLAALPAAAEGGAAAPALRPLRSLKPLRLLAGEKVAVGEVVRLNANENPLGPSPAAIEAMRGAFGLAWRYPDEHAAPLEEELAKLHGVVRRQVLLGNGSSQILQLCAAACCGPGRAAVAAEPTFEAILHHASTAGAPVLKVPLTADYRHDLPRMLAAAQGAGLIYLCNPNNPTGTLTPRDEVRAFLAQAPSQTAVVVDEAYFHFVDSADYESVIPLVREHANLVVARTFSKIYGMAGLRCGYAVAAPAMIERLRAHQPFDSVNIMALVAARASLADADHVAHGRQVNAEIRKTTVSELAAMGYRSIPSATNFFMTDLRREVTPVIQALRERRVEVGRLFPALPHFLRVTVGTAEQMRAFLAAFRQVVA